LWKISSRLYRDIAMVERGNEEDFRGVLKKIDARRIASLLLGANIL
jgi:hypothetical protein